MIRLEEWASLSPAAVGGMHNLLGVYKPYINYSWSSTYQAQEYKTDGVELVTNGGFGDGSNGWLKSASVSIVDEKATSSGGIADYSFVLNQSGIIEDGVLYKMTFDVEVISGSIRAGLGYNATGVEVEVSGSHVFIGEASQTSDEGVMIRTRTSDFIGSIDNVSVQKVIQEPNKMYTKNLGKSKSPLALYSGQGVKFNGVDQSVEVKEVVDIQDGSDMSVSFTFTYSDVTDSTLFSGKYGAWGFRVRPSGSALFIASYTTTSAFLYTETNTFTAGESYNVVCLVKGQTSEIYVNGEIVSSEQGVGDSRLMTGFVLGSQDDGVRYIDTTLKDFYIFNRALTQTEITKYSTNPNGFFNDALVDNTCVLNMPLAEHSDYCIDYANYSEVEKYAVGSATGTGWIDNEDGTFTCNGTTGWLSLQPIISTDDAKPLKTTIEIINITSGGVRNVSAFGGNTDAPMHSTVGLHSNILILHSSGIRYIRSEAFIGTIRVVSIAELSGIHQIKPYTDSCRDEAKQLPYGSQNANYKINSLGMRTEESPYFECNELFDNYGDTGWVPSATEDWSIELIMDFKGDGPNRWQGWSNELHIGERSNTSLKPRAEVYGDSTAYLIAPTQVTVGFHMMTLVKSGDNYTLFVDGVFSVDGMTTNPVFTNSLLLGGYRDDIFINVVDRQFKVHQKALTQEEVTKAYTDAVNKGLLV